MIQPVLQALDKRHQDHGNCRLTVRLIKDAILRSAGTLIAPPLAQTSLAALCASRVLVGLGEGFAPSAATNIMARLIPETERSRAVSYVFGGLDLGSVVGLLLCGPLIAAFGWSSVFYVFAVLGLAWALVWPLVRPEKVDEVMKKEALIMQSLEAERKAKMGHTSDGSPDKVRQCLTSVDPRLLVCCTPQVKRNQSSGRTLPAATQS